ncbi:MAG TPA: hypothetical protein VF828_03475 [Patescibacteria group bacterium]
MKIRLPFILALIATLFVVSIYVAYNYGINHPLNTVSAPIVRTPVVVVSPTASLPLPTSTPSPVLVPATVSAVFSAINKNLSTNLVPVAENEFYSPSGFISKKSWKMDLKPALKNKSSNTILINTFRTLGLKNTNSAGAGPNNIDEYQDNSVICYFSTGTNSTGGPETWTPANSYAYLSCTGK